MVFRTLFFGALRKLLGAIIQHNIFQHSWNSSNILIGVNYPTKNGTSATCTWAAKVWLNDQNKKLAERLDVADDTMELKLHVLKLLCQVCPRPTQTMLSP